MMAKDVTNSFISTGSVKERHSGALNGLTFGIKDSIPVKGMRCTSGSRIFVDHYPEKNSKVVDTILFNGGEIVGKTNLHEFAIGGTNTSSLIGPCRNPYDLERISGGSSGGSAAAVASGIIDVGIGTDTGGSVRIPAALCGIFGYKPSNMYVKSDSEIPFSDIMETTGVLTRNFTTLKWVVRELFPNLEEMEFDAETIRVGIFGDVKDANFTSFIDRAGTGSRRITVDYAKVPLLEKEGARMRRLISARDGYEGHKDMMKDHACDYFPDVRQILESGSRVEKSEYEEALSLRKDVIAQYNDVLFDFDVLICPTTGITAPKILDVVGKESSYREELVGITELFNLVGAPSISVPSGFIEGLPTGMLISGGPGDDSKTLKIAETISALVSPKA